MISGEKEKKSEMSDYRHFFKKCFAKRKNRVETGGEKGVKGDPLLPPHFFFKPRKITALLYTGR